MIRQLPKSHQSIALRSVQSDVSILARCQPKTTPLTAKMLALCRILSWLRIEIVHFERNARKDSREIVRKVDKLPEKPHPVKL